LPDTAGTSISVCPVADLPDGSMRLVEHEGRKIGVFNCEGTLYAI
jgi:3-phenylpropionate/trans-cinnamate dioxygenase ferredoxin subunit